MGESRTRAARHRARRGAGRTGTLAATALAGALALGLAAAPSGTVASPATGPSGVSAGVSSGVSSGVSAAAPASGPAAGTAAAPRRPNIVVVMADDMRQDDLRFAPNVRRLFRAGGVEFRNSFSNFPLCCPARASFLTGRLAHNHKVYSHLRPYGFAAFDDSRTIARSLRRRGYRTGFVGKYLNGYGAQRSRVTGRGSYTYVPRGWTQWYGALERPPRSKRPRGGTYHFTRTIYNINGKPSGLRFRGEYQTRTMGRFARRLVGRFAPGPKPFFLYLSFVAPHHGGPPERDDPRPRKVGGKQISYPTPAVPRTVRGRFDRTVRRAPGVPAGGRDPHPRIGQLPAFLRLPALVRHDRRALREMTRQRAESIHVLDRQVGRLVAELRRRGELSRTVLVFTSDNGYLLGEHRVRGGKIRSHEASLRVPLLMRGPGVPRGERRYAPVTTVDQAATVLDLADATGAHPRPLDGRSVLPDLASDPGWDQPVLYESMFGPQRRDGRETVVDPDRAGRLNARKDPAFTDARQAIGVRTGRWSYVRYRSGARELYDLAEDPDQLRNRTGDAGVAEVEEQLAAVWRQLRDCRGSACLTSLPPSLGTSREETGTLTERWFRSVRR